MKHPASKALFSYWASLCKGRRVPDRSALDPAAMRGVLAHTFMLEVDGVSPSSRRFPVRISGTRVDALLGRSLKNVDFADLWAEEDADEMTSMVAGALDDQQPLVVGLQASPHGYAPTACELLLLPLRHNGRTHARLLGSLIPLVTPRWIGLMPVGTLSLTGWRALDTNLISLEAGAAPPVAIAQGRRRDHLVVYDGGRAAQAPAAQHGINAISLRSRLLNLSTHLA